jgi:hypothetical protein
MPPDTAELRDRLLGCWSARTSSKWSSEKPSRGQCSVTSLVLQDHFGGEILRTPTAAGWHYYNRIDGLRLDLTADQFSNPLEYRDAPASRDDALADTTPAQYHELARRFGSAIGRHDLAWQLRDQPR